MKRPKGYRGGDAARSDAASGRNAGRADPSGGVDRSAVGAGSQFAKNRAKQNLEIQRKKAIETISPSTTFSGQAIKYGLMFSGVPFAGAVTNKLFEKTSTSMGYNRKKNNISKKNITSINKPKTIIGTGGGGGSNNLPILPIQATKAVDKKLINPTDNFFNFKAYNVGGLSGGVSYGPPPKRGPNPQVPPVKMKRGGHK
jgi:hypothetical protein|tara:strand:- start:658 stop:1254 length:597 start_codon:yes stop_codon:yes gene_type:complete